MKRLVIFLYGTVCYLIFFATFSYAIGFVGNVLVPRTLDSGTPGAFWPSVLINLGLLGLFGMQHSIMARPAFKRVWTKVIPEAAERSTYVLFSSLALILLFWQWRPLPDLLWHVEGVGGRLALWALYGLGWGLVLVSTFLISHAHLFGMRQAYDALKGRELWSPGFRETGLYRYLRHPIMLGFLIAFWATPDLSVGRLLFALVTTSYILVALRFEEHDLQQSLGASYAAYRRRVPMLIPGLRHTRPEEGREDHPVARPVEHA